MSIVLVGVNHKTAPVAVRERLAFSDEACAEGLRALVDGEVVREGLIVSTCNRVEVLTATGTQHAREGTERITRFLSEIRSIPYEDINKHLYTHADHEAFGRVFPAPPPLESMVDGEPQGLGQVRRAYSLAVESGTAGRVLNRLVHHAFHVAKRVRSETGIAASAVSISYMAVELGRKIFGSLKGHTILLIGAGEMAELSARHLLNAGASRLLITNRTDEAANRLASEFGGTAAPFEELEKTLADADIVICSTGAPTYVVTEEMVRKSRRRNRPMCLIDISVPRNIDPNAGNVPNVFVFDIDDLESVISSNIREREREAERAELIVQSEVMQFQQSLRLMDVGPTIGALREKLQDVARTELQRQRKRLGPLTPDQEAAVEQLLMATVNKISHPVLNQMRRLYETSDAETMQELNDSFGNED